MGTTYIENMIDREYFGMKLGLDKISTLLERMDHPERSYPSIHIAGTNGKGSTAIMLSRILEVAGYRVGLFSSPHLQSFTERFQINGVSISEERLEQISEKIERFDAVDAADHLSFFECMTAIAFKYFEEESVDVAVIEVGLGGRLDATNVLHPSVSVITPIHRDHEAHLGHDVEVIAREKGGIIKEGVPVISAPQRSEVRQVLEEIAEQKGTSIHFVEALIEMSTDGSFNFEGFYKLWLPVLGSVQMLNACTAITTARRWMDIPREAIYRGLASSYLPGRMEIIRRQPLILLDGAHNPDALTHLVATFQQNFRSQPIKCLFAVMEDKDVEAMLDCLRALDVELHLVPLAMKRALPVDLLANKAHQQGFRFHKHPSCREALETLLGHINPNEQLLVTGSFFLVGEVRGLLQ